MPDSNAPFRSVLRGYDPAEVDQQLHELAHAVAAARLEAGDLTIQVNQLEDARGQLMAEVERHALRAHELEEAARECAEPTYTGLGERICSILTLADLEASELRTRARADAANHLALADENALAIRQDADDYAMQTRSSADDDIAAVLEESRQQADDLLEDAREQADNLLEDAKQQADNLLEDADRQTMARQDADRQAMAQREEAEAVYERARAKSAAAAVDFETTLAARRDKSAMEFAAQVAASEQQLAAVRQRSEQTRHDSEQAQQETAAKCAQQLSQAMEHAKAVVAEAKAKAERIRENSERELAATTQRRDSISAQLTIVRQDLAALGGVTRFNPTQMAELVARETETAADAQEEIVVEVQG